jgi:hypothetical protein
MALERLSLELADYFNWLAQAAASPAVIRQWELPRQGQKAPLIALLYCLSPSKAFGDCGNGST